MKQAKETEFTIATLMSKIKNEMRNSENGWYVFKTRRMGFSLSLNEGIASGTVLSSWRNSCNYDFHHPRIPAPHSFFLLTSMNENKIEKTWFQELDQMDTFTAESIRY